MTAIRTSSALLIGIAVTLGTLHFTSAQSETTPTEPLLPVVSYDACPGKGRIVPNWKIGRRATLFSSWKRKSAAVGTLNAGDRVTVLAGVIVAYEPDVISVRKSMADLWLEPGDRILRYAYYADGESDIWAKGLWHSHYPLVGTKEYGTPCGDLCESVVIQQGIIDSWVQVRTASKVTGWALDYRQSRGKFGSDSNFANLCAD